MKQSVQMWDNRHLTILEGIPVTIPSAPAGYTFLFCQENETTCSIVCVECGLRVSLGKSKREVSRKAYRLFLNANHHMKLADYMFYTVAAYNAYKAYIVARAGMWETCPSSLLSQPRFPLFNHHHLEDV
jgi:hypothetical protein